MVEKNFSTSSFLTEGLKSLDLGKLRTTVVDAIKPDVIAKLAQEQLQVNFVLSYVYILRLIGPISYLGACYIRTTVTKYIREKMTLYFRR